MDIYPKTYPKTMHDRLGAVIAFVVTVCLIGIATPGVRQTELVAMSAVDAAVIMPQAVAPSETLQNGWRRTRFGWEDSTMWIVDDDTPHPKVELIHPLVWTALVLFAVMGTTVWATEEWELSRFSRRA